MAGQRTTPLARNFALALDQRRGARVHRVAVQMKIIRMRDGRAKHEAPKVSALADFFVSRLTPAQWSTQALAIAPQ